MTKLIQLALILISFNTSAGMSDAEMIECQAYNEFARLAMLSNQAGFLKSSLKHSVKDDKIKKTILDNAYTHIPANTRTLKQKQVNEFSFDVQQWCWSK
ncbi:hypothetical protein [Vibrio sp. 1S139]|uniref:hypothetical protein n=1 Tax=Vibrio sp. 1S139 TaxID=3230006 RepID=UPI00352E58B5